jgi:hypothetical protein
VAGVAAWEAERGGGAAGFMNIRSRERRLKIRIYQAI